MLNNILFFLFFTLTFTNASFESHATNVKIVTFVNSEVITNIDIKKESQYLKIFNPNLEQLEEEKILELSKKSLIIEKVKKNEISKFIDLQNDKNKFLESYLNNFYKKLNYQNQIEFVNDLKEKNTYSVEEIKNKLNIELFWNELIYNKYIRLIKIDEQNLKTKIKKNMKNLDKKEYNLSEIVFKKNNKLSLKEQVEIIKTSIKEIGFENTANIYSISQNSKFGGLVGWVHENNLSEIIVNNINNLAKGKVTDVIEINNNYLILKINDIRTIKLDFDYDRELRKLVEFETNKELEKFSKIYFDKTKINSLIREN